MTTKKGATMTVAEARALLGISPATMAKLIRQGELHAETDPLDKRYKLVKRSEVAALLARSRQAHGEEHSE